MFYSSAGNWHQKLAPATGTRKLVSVYGPLEEQLPPVPPIATCLHRPGRVYYNNYLPRTLSFTANNNNDYVKATLV